MVDFQHRRGMCGCADDIESVLAKNRFNRRLLGVLIAFFVGIPVFVYSNIKGLTWLTVASSLGIVAITTLFALLFPRREPFRLPPVVEAEPSTA